MSEFLPFDDLFETWYEKHRPSGFIRFGAMRFWNINPSPSIQDVCDMIDNRQILSLFNVGNVWVRKISKLLLDDNQITQSFYEQIVKNYPASDYQMMSNAEKKAFNEAAEKAYEERFRKWQLEQCEKFPFYKELYDKGFFDKGK